MTRKELYKKMNLSKGEQDIVDNALNFIRDHCEDMGDALDVIADY